MLLLLLAASSILSLPTSLQTDPADKPLDAAAVKKLDDGEVLTTLVDTPGNPVEKGVALAVVDAPVDQVFAVITDYEHHADFMPFVAKSEVSKRDGNDLTLHQYLEFPLGIGDRNYEIEVTLGQTVVDGVTILQAPWKYTGVGNLKDTTGAWECTPLADGRTLVRYVCNTDPGGSFPDWIKNASTKMALPRLMKALRKRVAAQAAAAKKQARN
jgi:ribosome-associated toxin RatA of RatAB toxin-antitoxin module